MHFSIDTFMTRELKLSKTKLLVYAVIHSFSQGDNGCYWASITTTAEDLGVTPMSVQNAIRSLTKRGLIKCVGIHQTKRTNQYVAIVPNEGKKILGGYKKCTLEGKKNIPIGVKKFDPIINSNKDNNNGVTSIFDR